MRLTSGVCSISRHRLWVDGADRRVAESRGFAFDVVRGAKQFIVRFLGEAAACHLAASARATGSSSGSAVWTTALRSSCAAMITSWSAKVARRRIVLVKGHLLFCSGAPFRPDIIRVDVRRRSGPKYVLVLMNGRGLATTLRMRP